MAGRQKITKALTAFFFIAPAALEAFCPDLAQYYPLIDDNPVALESNLFELTSECSDNSEYFALLGSVQLSLGKVLVSRENLELALLINPENGSALIDYAETFFELGEIFTAIDLNLRLLERDDLPAGLRESIAERGMRWRSVTRNTRYRVSALAGYDNNLNSAPFSRQLALTLSGESVLLAVSPNFRPLSGEYSNLIFGGEHTRTGPGRNIRIAGETRGRFGTDHRHNILQANAQVGISEAGERGRWALQVDTAQLNYGGNSIFTSTTLRASLRAGRAFNCEVFPRLAVQYQSFRIQRILGGIETSLGAGLDCSDTFGVRGSRFGVELLGLNNKPTKTERLGGDRDGWQFNLMWQAPLGRGTLSAQYSRTELNDELGYSPIFKDGARRREALDSAYLSYSVPVETLGPGVRFIANAYFREQRNTIALFRVEGATAEVGLSFEF